MKKFTYLLLALLITLQDGCSSNNQAKHTTKDPKTKEESVAVDKGLFNVKLTLPASMFEGDDINKVIADAEKEGIKVTKNTDGSLTYKMSKSQHKKMIKSIKDEIIKTVNETKESKDFISLKDITYNNDFTEFTLIVDKSAYENSMDGLAAFTFGMSGMMYQLYNGVDPNDYKVTILVKDQDTQKEFDKIVYPDSLKDK
ncbi:hypothetical protein BED47_07565 [Gottfriedia luciferensis]|uniref:Antigen I/II N-terminal domain-containing protein n=1 Tax=Gottfriedia luciferensis TaxID=178774 RepID=A0ABX2ZP53_9BACI|nr:hypothetical protein [Gottfriedia luciferensis]ODG91502.1 hypothetical protein BED47_07565 [Gottfriedia luciferensis]